ncbi:hypothetical protein J6590_070804 [Homalodisca vitripennis]|nr:hypothetical protein J6590_070804 [Homalodisca vitripennis]
MVCKSTARHNIDLYLYTVQCWLMKTWCLRDVACDTVGGRPMGGESRADHSRVSGETQYRPVSVYCIVLTDEGLVSEGSGPAAGSEVGRWEEKVEQITVESAARHSIDVYTVQCSLMKALYLRDVACDAVEQDRRRVEQITVESAARHSIDVYTVQCSLMKALYLRDVACDAVEQDRRRGQSRADHSRVSGETQYRPVSVYCIVLTDEGLVSEGSGPAAGSEVGRWEEKVEQITVESAARHSIDLYTRVTQLSRTGGGVRGRPIGGESRADHSRVSGETQYRSVYCTVLTVEGLVSEGCSVGRPIVGESRADHSRVSGETQYRSVYCTVLTVEGLVSEGCSVSQLSRTGGGGVRVEQITVESAARQSIDLYLYTVQCSLMKALYLRDVACDTVEEDRRRRGQRSADGRRKSSRSQIDGETTSCPGNGRKVQASHENAIIAVPFTYHFIKDLKAESLLRLFFFIGPLPTKSYPAKVSSPIQRILHQNTDDTSNGRHYCLLAHSEL